MSITFSVAVKKFEEFESEALASEIKTWLDSLGITTIYEISISFTLHGFWEAVVIYE
jgi:hypothetical protein